MTEERGARPGHGAAQRLRGLHRPNAVPSWSAPTPSASTIHTDAAVRREFAWRTLDRLRPLLDTVLSIARSAMTAANALTEEIGDVHALDECTDRLNSSELSRPLGEACGALRVELLQFRGTLRLQKQMIDHMTSVGGDSLIGHKIAKHGEEVEHRTAALFAAAKRVVAEEQALMAHLESEQKLL